MRDTVMVGLRRYAFCDMGCWHRVAAGESLTAHNKVSEDVNACLDALAASQAELADWKANAQRENAALVQAQQRIAELEQEREDVRRGLKSVAGLIAESGGVYGLHLNGDVSPWPELRSGGRYEEWLADFDAALGRMLNGVADAPLSSSPQAQNTEGENG